MNKQHYISPEACELTCGLFSSVLITSGGDDYHYGGGGRYGDEDLNLNDFDY